VPVIPVEAPDDPRVAGFAAVADPELARTRGLFVAEGRLVVRRVVEDGRYALHAVLVSAAARDGLDDVLARLDPGVPVYVCRPSFFQAVTGFDLHRGCLALVARPPAAAPADLVRASRTIVALESIANADNVGGVFRNAAAFGADAVLLDAACCDPLYRKAIRTSMAASVRIPFARCDDWPAALAGLRAEGFTIVALTPREPALTLSAFAGSWRGGRIALLLGNEGDGLSETAEAAADCRVRIPTTRDVDSLNVVVAAGIVLSRLTDFAEL
jgi:tRNA G18 (ribose-2'-O)-methylase SpoU